MPIWTRNVANAVIDATNEIKQNVAAGSTLSSDRTSAFLRYRANNGENAAQVTSNGENLNREKTSDVGRRRFIRGKSLVCSRFAAELRPKFPI